ncbi:MAG: SGNH/GDSL hydrolase family protein [Deltaproteobacteria bacterium]|nr:SGNH/GDSL hydrolase family protein [Deltaproteobacteria bacterium]
MSRESGPGKRPAFVAPLVTVLVLLAIEVVCRVFIAPSRLEKILAILERDPALIWRLRANLDTVFESQPVRTGTQNLRGATFAVPKPEGTFRVVALGASPTFGWGVPEADAYPPWAQSVLAGREITAEVINGGTPGYTTWQGVRRLRDHVLGWSPDVVTVAYDLNDLDRFRFFNNDGRVDAEQHSDAPARVAIQNALNRSAAYGLLRRGLLRAASRQGAFDPEAMPRRVPLEHYRANLLEIDRICRENGVELVYLKMPINLPFQRLAVIDPIEAVEERRRGDEARAAGDWPRALTHYRDAQRLDPTIVATYQALLDAERHEGLTAEAAKTEDLIPFVAAFRDRADLEYNRAVEDIARETNRPLVDVVAAFDADGRGDGLWNSVEDPFHPNAAGHHIIGELVAARIESIARARQARP